MTDIDDMIAKSAITELTHRYSQAITRGDFHAWSQCFTDDGVFVTDGVTRGEIQQFDAHADLERFAAIAQKIVDDTPDRRNHVTSIQIVVDGDKATARTFVLGTSSTGDGSMKVNGAGQLDDKLAKVDGQWKFRERRFHQDGV